MAVVESAEAGLRAAPRATSILLRAPKLSAAELEREALRLGAESPIQVLVSSRCDVALAANVAGVNLPERDISVADARILLATRIIGRSVHSVTAANAAELERADFVIFGPIWASASHPGVEPKGLAALKDLVDKMMIPVLAIGGVTEERVADVHATGAAGFAAIGMFR
jgi:thiazole tautomerase (transcriptional regulator TenI)